eukprot:TRINITY_DN4416_c0_g2_i1.p1 TRINITY_DN4416_c0_g2~~TRINITY_DN4416_c0_g2_i1.p1  ORF type:complete len:328 (-),score=85.64 TRINITY_DN4416_c0_g2_i1:276-1259(-)
MGCNSSKSVAAAAPVPVPAPATTESPKVQDDVEQESGETRVPSETHNATGEQADANLQSVLEIFRSVLVGFVGEALPAVMTVLKTSGEALQEFRAAVEAFQAQDAVKGLGLLAESLQTLATALGDADMAKEQVDSFVKALEMLRDPKQILNAGRELLVNGKDILGHIEKAVAAFNDQDWQAFGQEIGGVIVDILLPAKAQSSEAAPPVDTVQGLGTEDLMPVAASTEASVTEDAKLTSDAAAAPQALLVETVIEKAEPKENVVTGDADKSLSAMEVCTEPAGSVEEEETTAKDDAVPQPILVGSNEQVVQKSNPWLFGSCCSVATSA